MNQQEKCLWLIRELLDEMPQYRDTPIPVLLDHRWRLLRSLMNVRPPIPETEEFCRIQDAFLQEMTKEKVLLRQKDCRLAQRMRGWCSGREISRP